MTYVEADGPFLIGDNQVANIRIIGKKGSKAMREISDGTGIKLYTGQRQVDAIVNYGAAGKRLGSVLKKYAAIKNIPIINKYVGLSKLIVVRKAQEVGILVPESKGSLLKKDRLSDWIEKRIHSSQGNGICKARGRKELSGKYYQRMISDRRYELRVHAFLWVPKKEWAVNKRVGPIDQIAWNFHQGGHFQSVKFPNSYDVFLRAKDVAEKMLKTVNMAFGAVDFIVDNNMDIHFIEINSAPGFTALNQDVYFNAMLRLKELPVKKLAALGRM